MFDFKYIPDISKETQMEDALTSDLKEAEIERRNLQALGIGCVVFALVAVLGLKIWATVVNCAITWLP